MSGTAIYARLSLDRKGDQLGVSRQLTECRELAGQLGLTVDAEFVDNDTSATNGKARPQFEALLQSRPSAVIAWHQDRLLRLGSDLERVITLDVPIYTVAAGTLDLTNPAGRAVARTVAAWSTYEGEQRAARMAAERRQGLARGKDLGGPRPFGFEPDRVTIREGEAELIRLGCRMILDGASLRAVKKAWNDSGVREELFLASTVRKILVRPRNVGRLVVGGVDYGRNDRPAILNEDEHSAMCAVIANRPRTNRGAGPESPRWAAVGTVACAVCSSRLEASVVAKGVRVVRCSGRGDGRKHPTMRAESLEEQLSEATLGKILARVAKGDDLDKSAPPEVAALTLRLAELRRKRGVAQEMATWEGADLAAIRGQVAALGADIDAARADLDRALARDATGAAVELAKRFVVTLGGGGYAVLGSEAREPWGTYWEGLAVTERRTLLRGLFRSIELLPHDKAYAGRLRLDGIMPFSTAEPGDIGEVWEVAERVRST